MDVHLEYQPFNKIYEMLAEQTIDFGFVAYPKKRQGILIETFDEEEMVLAQSAQRPTLNGRNRHLRDLNGVKFVTFSSGTPTREFIDHFFKIKGIAPTVVHEYDNIETLKSAILLGMGCSLVPKNTLRQELHEKTLQILPVRGLKLSRPLGILRTKGKIFTEAAQAFYDMIVRK